ncbi:MAG: hypothetical protein ACRDPJ_02680 [Nocardioidaceae bacterium]
MATADSTIPRTHRALIELAATLAAVGALTAAWANLMVDDNAQDVSDASGRTGSVVEILNPARTPEDMDNAQPEDFGQAALEIAGLADAR